MKPFKVAVMHNGSRYSETHRHCLNLLMDAVNKGHTVVQVEYVDCKKIRDLETFISKWLRFEENCIKQSGPYASQTIPKMMEEARELLGLGLTVIIDDPMANEVVKK